MELDHHPPSLGLGPTFSAPAIGDNFHVPANGEGGGGVEFGDLAVTFIVDEDLKNYNSIYKWMRDNGNADQMARATPEKDIFSNGQLLITTSQYNPAFVVDFQNLFPVALTNLQFDATIGDVEYITANVTFKHQQFFLRDKAFKKI